MKVISGLFETYQEANSAIAALSIKGYSGQDISVVGQEEVLKHEPHSETAETAGKGAAIGGIIGLIAGVAPIAIPGVGAIIGAGTLIGGTLGGAGVGAAAGGLVGLLKKWFGSEDHATKVEHAIREGKILIAVKTGQRNGETVAQIMRDHGASEVHEHAAAAAHA